MAIVLIPGIDGSELVDSYLLSWPRRWSMEDMMVGDILMNNERMGLGLAALLLWAGLTYAIFLTLIVKQHKPHLDQGLDSGWLLAVVAAQSIVVPGAQLAAPQGGQSCTQELNVLALSMWL